MNEELYIITEDYFNEFSDLLDPDYLIGTIVTQDEDGVINKVAQRGDNDPINPPPKRPPILP